MKRSRWLLSLGLTTTLALWADDVRLERIPENGLQPDAIADERGQVHLIYLTGDPKGADIHYTSRKNPTHPWSKPVVVNSQPGSAIAIGTVRGPRLALGQNGRAHVVWNGSSTAEPKVEDSSPLLVSRLSDDGTQFEPQRNLLGGTRHLDGGAAITSNLRGTVWVVWHAAPKSVPAGGDSEMMRGIYLAQSNDEGRTFRETRRIDSPELGVCACCGLDATFEGPDRLSILYRGAENGTNRGMIYLTSGDNGRTFASHRLDDWKLSQCPMTTSRFLANSSLAAWPRQGRIQFGQLKSNGSIPLENGSSELGAMANHPVAVRGKDGRLLLAWTEGTGWQRGGTLAWSLTRPENAEAAKIQRGPNVPVWGFPAAACESDGKFTIWY